MDQKQFKSIIDNQRYLLNVIRKLDKKVNQLTTTTDNIQGNPSIDVTNPDAPEPNATNNGKQLESAPLKRKRNTPTPSKSTNTITSRNYKGAISTTLDRVMLNDTPGTGQIYPIKELTLQEKRGRSYYRPITNGRGMKSPHLAQAPGLLTQNPQNGYSRQSRERDAQHPFRTPSVGHENDNYNSEFDNDDDDEDYENYAIQNDSKRRKTQHNDQANLGYDKIIDSYGLQ